MVIKRKIKKFVEKLMNIHIYRQVPRGIDLCYDISKHLSKLDIKVVFDVGANVGQSVKNYLHWFPGSTIYCFEPSSDTFRQLFENTKDNKRIKSFQLALGRSRGKEKMMILGKLSSMNSLANVMKNVPKNNTFELENVDIEKIDNFCRVKNIKHIDFLKVDTEGNDLEVLRGADDMFSNQRIDLVEVEAGMNPGNKRHVSFDKIKKFLESKNYFLFGIYEQIGEYSTKEAHLRRTNPVFISKAAIERNCQ